jgi:hypothetical protein
MKSKLKILVVFVVMFFASFIPDSNHKLFGDWLCKGNYITHDKNDNAIITGCKYEGYNAHNSTWHWGSRHWLFLIAGLTFSVWTIIDVIIEEDKKHKK